MGRQLVSHEDGAIYEFTPDLEGTVTVQPGAELTIETRDSLDGAAQAESDVIDDPAIDLRRPLVETPGAWKTIASAETLEEACELANEDAIRLLAAEHGFDSTDAYLFSSLVGGLEISQVVDPLVTVRNAVPREYLSSPF